MTDASDTDHVWHSFYEIINTLPKVWPYRHMVIENFLHPDLFAAVRSVDLAKLVTQRNPQSGTSEAERYYITIRSERDADATGDPALAALWKTLTDPKLADLLPKKFADEIRKRHADEPLSIEFGIEIIEDRTGYALLPHVDTVQKLVTTLIYLAEPDADPSLGTSIYGIDKPHLMPAERRDNSRLPRDAFALVKTVPYRANTALIFAPGDNTFHGVEPVAGGSARRLIQFQINRVMNR